MRGKGEGKSGGKTGKGEARKGSGHEGLFPRRFQCARDIVFVRAVVLRLLACSQVVRAEKAVKLGKQRLPRQLAVEMRGWKRWSTSFHQVPQVRKPQLDDSDSDEEEEEEDEVQTKKAMFGVRLPEQIGSSLASSAKAPAASKGQPQEH